MKRAIVVLISATMLAIASATPALAFDWQAYIDRFTPIRWHWEYAEEEAEEQDAFTIEYDCNGGGWFNIYKTPAFSNSASYEVEAGETHKVASAPTRGGYMFIGWRDEDGNSYKAGQAIAPTEDMTLTAAWAWR